MFTNKTASRILVCAGLAMLTSACIARGPDDYRAVTRSLVDTKNSDIEACFHNNPGTVVVEFTVEKKTGKIANATVTEATSAPENVGKCVLSAIEGLAIDRPDMRDGAATFTWTLKAS